MELNEPRCLIDHIRNKSLRTRIGIWVIPNRFLGHERDVAVNLGLEAVDVCDLYKKIIPNGSKYLGLESANIIEVLDKVASESGINDCVLIFNLDFFLAGLKADDRQKIWQDLFNGFPYRKRALLLTIPVKATYAFPQKNNYEDWLKANRLVE